MDDYLQRILRARVYDVAHETPLELAKNLSRRFRNKIWLKREDLQPVFSFKLRGAYNRMSLLSQEELQRGVIASSAGNHAQGVALSSEDIANVLSYVRRNIDWGDAHNLPLVTPEQVQAVRASEAIVNRTTAWTADELIQQFSESE